MGNGGTEFPEAGESSRVPSTGTMLSIPRTEASPAGWTTSRPSAWWCAPAVAYFGVFARFYRSRWSRLSVVHVLERHRTRSPCGLHPEAQPRADSYTILRLEHQIWYSLCSTPYSHLVGRHMLTITKFPRWGCWTIS